nr:transglutaminase domain-containing protein [Auraticoccus cholistanensis]
MAAVTFQLTFGGVQVWVAALGGAVLGLAIGVLGAWRRLPTWQVAVLVAAGYLLFGGALALPGTTTAGLPGLRTLTDLVFGVVTSWRGLLTVDAPVEGIGELMVVPLITMLLAGVVGSSVALRSTRPTLAWLAPATALGVGISFGIAEAHLPVLVGVGFALVALTWTAYRRDTIRQSLLGQRRTTRWQSAVLAVGVLAVAAGVAGASAPLVEPDGYRTVLREEVEPPLDVLDYPSPLQSFRGNIKDHEEDTLLTLSGLPEDAAVRIATLDTYDGITFNVSSEESAGRDSGLFKRMGRSVPEDTEGTAATVTVTVNGYSGVWLPTVGKVTRARFTSPRGEEVRENLFYNRVSGTGITTVGVREGDSYTLDVVVPREPTTDQIRSAEAGDAELAPAEPVPDPVADAAQRWSAGSASSGEALLAVEEELRRGFYSNGLEGDAPSPSGHSAGRIQQLLDEDQMIGDEEQYAVAMALAARSLGVPSRVVYGYQPESSGEVAIKGRDVTAWTEVQLEGLGWVILRPTPDKSQAPEPDESEREARPRPQVDNPPPPPERPDYQPPDNTPPEEPKTDEDDRSRIDWGLVGLVAAAVGIPLLLLGLPVALVLGLKARRRKARLLAATTSARVAGGWAEVVDRARDLGVTPAPTATRREVAATVVQHFPTTREGPANPHDLAWRADVSTFGPRQPSQAQVDLYWQGVDELRHSMGESVSWWRRLRAALSPASLRR